MRLTAPLTVLVNHLGYAATGTKKAVVATTVPVDVTSARLVRVDAPDPGDVSREESLAVGPEEQVPGWTTGTYRRIELPEQLAPGTYRVEVVAADQVHASRDVIVGDHRLQYSTVSDVAAYFRAVRSSGEIDRKDRHARFYGDGSGREVDARGGWLDASGDFSKFLSHLTYTRMMSPQQIPLCAWALMAARDELEHRHPELWRAQGNRLRDEALFGADFLVRFQSPEGYFYTGIFDALTKDLHERVITAPLQDSVRTQRWQAGYRHGGGLAVAALARASTLDDDGEATRAGYLAAAVRGFEHLETHNREYLFDGEESVIDDYCALLAASELLVALREPAAPRSADEDLRATVEEAARRRATSLCDRYRTDPDGIGFLEGDVLGRPFFHAAETGLPQVALLRFAEAVPDVGGDVPLAARARRTALALALATASRVDDVPNPFGYLRQYVQPDGEEPRTAFFYPHANETGYWWQGENANVSSVAYAAVRCAELDECPPDARARLLRLADDQVHWVTGLNPFDASMLQGRGANNVEYSTAFQNVPGGILNGITSGFDDEQDVDFMPPGPAGSGDSWRWAEQWIPHTGWFLLAVSAVR
ncbi:glycoside hydrolase family 9 protein [Oerskovia enterophila]|uniref:Glycosyl hydrolase family 9 n=1 Tax=Oerskovia enterophila TaxID=43678 RepID=A0A163Q177_9CELL|nr:glycoside hydrolase family 9 protein [Oerskovia enterophila]KZM33709.1 glycosyl hydrolase family 9 [Oerskovia enterophila]